MCLILLRVYTHFFPVIKLCGEVSLGKGYYPALISFIKSLAITEESIKRERESEIQIISVDAPLLGFQDNQTQTKNSQNYFRDLYRFFRLSFACHCVPHLSLQSKWTHFPEGSSGQWSVNKLTVMRRRMSLCLPRVAYRLTDWFRRWLSCGQLIHHFVSMTLTALLR